MRRYDVRGCALLLVLGSTPFAAAEQMVENGDFETGAYAPAWSQLVPYYPGSPTEVFPGQFIDDYPMLSAYAGTYSCGWRRSDGPWTWPGGDSTRPSNAIRQSWVVDPGTYPVSVSLTAFVHHNRTDQLEDHWGAGISLRLYVDGGFVPVWLHEIWPREGDSFWQEWENLENETGDELNLIQTSTGNVTFEIAWITKWTADLDTCAVDNVQVDLVGATRHATLYGGDSREAGEVRNTRRTAASEVLPNSGADRVFRSATDYAVGLNPAGLALGDFNGDGILDLATVNDWNHTMTILVGEGGGRFGPRADYPTGHNPKWVVSTDTNNDDHLDLVVTNWADNTCGVYLGRGDGTFDEPLLLQTGNDPWCVAAAHMTQDSHIDLLVTEERDNTLALYHGAGDGSFVREGSYAVSDWPRFVTTADFNKDGQDDVLVACFMAGEIYSFRGTPAGSLLFREQLRRDEWQVAALAVGDFDQDGNLDFFDCETFPSQGKYWLGRGDNTFRHGEKIAFARQGVSLVSMDSNHDGIPDIAAAQFETNDIFVQPEMGVGFPLLGHVISYACGDSPRCLVTADLDQDGSPDYITANGDANTVSVLLGRADGTVAAAASYSISSWPGQPLGVAMADFDGDNDLDIVMTNVGGWDGDRVDVWRNDGDVYLQRAHIDVPGGPCAVAVGDFDNDRVPDLAVARRTAKTLRVMLGEGDLTFPQVIDRETGSQPFDVLAVDVNNDGALDILTANRAANSVSVLTNNGEGTGFARHDVAVGLVPTSAVSGYFNGDANLDLATANSFDDNVTVLLGQGDGNFTASTVNVGASPQGITAGDWNSDGRLDLAVTNNADNTVTLLFGDGEGAFRNPASLPAGRGPMFATTADFNGDGRDDLAFGNDGDGTVWVLVSRGDGTFQGPQSYWASRNPRRLAAGDLWNDGRPELAVCTAGEFRWQLFVNDRAGGASFRLY